MTAFFDIFGSPANAFTLAIVIVIAVERLITAGYLKIGKNGRVRKEETEEKIPEWAERLMNHYNHDTTKKLDETHSQQVEVCKKLDGMQRTLDEFKEYGVKIRNDNNKK